MKNKIISLVKNICFLLKDLDEPWAITGGCNVFLRECIHTLDDIDAITTRMGALLIFEAMKDYVTKDLSYSEVERIRAHFFEASIDGIRIEVMGDPENKIDGKWIKNTLWSQAIEYFKFDETQVPLTTLDYELNINRILNNQERVRVIEKCNP
ncbi:MAG: hypothetical protein F6K58_20295 [Symploca sp. SIO2E9]|nr:hypothetical protein [Symploca sp. SIO2E9]